MEVGKRKRLVVTIENDNSVTMLLVIVTIYNSFTMLAKRSRRTPDYRLFPENRHFFRTKKIFHAF
jgi:hypothetical protein